MPSIRRAHAIRLWKNLTIGVTLCFVKRRLRSDSAMQKAAGFAGGLSAYAQRVPTRRRVATEKWLASGSGWPKSLVPFSSLSRFCT